MTNLLTEWEYENAYDSADFSMKAEEEDVIIEMTKPARRKHTVTSRVINHKHKAKMVRMFDRNSDGYYSLSLYHFFSSGLIISPLGTHQSATRKTVIRNKERTNPKRETHQSAVRNALPDEVISE